MFDHEIAKSQLHFYMVLFRKIHNGGYEMREVEFKQFLINNSDIESKVKAVNSRVAKALMVERQLDINLDNEVKGDEKMYSLLLRIQKELNDGLHHNVYQNAVRKYYLFVNGKEFPRLKQYEKKRSL